MAAGAEKSTAAQPSSQLVDHWTHRILSLEADLWDRHRRGELSGREFRRKRKRLQRLRDSVDSFRVEPRETTEAHADSLPLPRRRTSTETQLCLRDLTKRVKTLRRVEKNLERVAAWLETTRWEDATPLKNVFRLSRLRRMIQESERELERQQTRSQDLDEDIEQMLSQAIPSRCRTKGRDTFGALVQMFTRLDRTMTRVSELRQKVSREKHRVQRTETHLNNVEMQIKASRVPTSTAAELGLAFLPPEEGAGFRENRHRKALVEEFWNEVLSEADEPDDKHARLIP